MDQELTAVNVLRLIKQLPPKELYKLADFMDIDADDGMFSCCVGDAISKADLDWSATGEEVVADLSMGFHLGDIKIKIVYENIAADGDDPDYGDYQFEIL